MFWLLFQKNTVQYLLHTTWTYGGSFCFCQLLKSCRFIMYLLLYTNSSSTLSFVFVLCISLDRLHVTYFIVKVMKKFVAIILKDFSEKEPNWKCLLICSFIIMAYFYLFTNACLYCCKKIFRKMNEMLNWPVSVILKSKISLFVLTNNTIVSVVYHVYWYSLNFVRRNRIGNCLCL